MNLGLTTLELTGLVLSSEFALIALLVPALLQRRHQQHQGVERADAEQLLDDVEARTPTRREALSTIFTSTYALDGAELEAKVDEFIAREQAFYQVMTSVYLERDSRRLQELPDELTKLIAPWLRLTPRNTVAAADLTALASANADLESELADTRHSMQALLDEYTAAFERERAASAPARSAASPPAPARVAAVAAPAPAPAAADRPAMPAASVEAQGHEPDEFDAIAGLFEAVTAELDTDAAAVPADAVIDIIDVSIDPDEVATAEDLDSAPAARDAAA